MRGRWGSGKNAWGNGRLNLRDVSLELKSLRREMVRGLRPGVFLWLYWFGDPAQGHPGTPAVPLLQSAVVLCPGGEGAAADEGARGNIETGLVVFCIFIDGANGARVGRPALQPAGRPALQLGSVTALDCYVGEVQRPFGA